MSIVSFYNKATKDATYYISMALMTIYTCLARVFGQQVRPSKKVAPSNSPKMGAFKRQATGRNQTTKLPAILPALVNSVLFLAFIHNQAPERSVLRYEMAKTATYLTQLIDEVNPPRYHMFPEVQHILQSIRTSGNQEKNNEELGSY